MASHLDPQVRSSTMSTGRWIAAARALETSRSDRLFNDPWAGELAGESGKAMLDAADYNPFLPVRTRYFDDQIIEALGADSQIVLLGAGLDTRAFRLPLAATCTVFELDYAEAFTQKDTVLRAVSSVSERRRVPADLSGTWTPALLKAGFDRLAPTVWVAEGLFFYLTASAVESLLRDTASLSAGGSTFLADIFGTGLLALESMAPLVKARTESGRALPFCTDTPKALFRASGWANTKLVQPGHPAANFGRLVEGPEATTAMEQQSTRRTYLVTATL